MPAHDWSDPRTLTEWNSHDFPRNPVRPEMIDIVTAILRDLYTPGAWTLDLGYGSGLVDEVLFQNVPDFRVVGVDSSPEMAALADERLAAYGDRYEKVLHDLAALESLALPKHDYHFAIAVQSLHHLIPERMRAAYAFIYRTLVPGGVFVLADRIRVDSPGLWPVYRSLWARLDRVHGSQLAAGEGATFADHERIVAGRGDLPVTPEEHVAWLRAAGFEAAVLYLHAPRAVIAARKV